MKQLVIILALGILSCSAIAATEITLISIEDTVVDSVNVTGMGINGKEASMRVQGFVPGPSSLNSIQRSYLKFNLSDIPENAVIETAVLRIYLDEINGGGFNSGDPHTSVHYVSNDGWSEGTLNWTDAELLGAEDGYMDDEFLMVDYGYKEWNLLSDSTIYAWDYAADLGGDDNTLSLMIKTPDEETLNNFAQFQTREGLNEPELVITYNIPEPASLCLLGLGGILLRRRRK